MKKLFIAALAAGTVFSFMPAASAAHEPWGFLCGFTSTEDPQVEGSQTGEIDGGPLVIEDATTPVIESGYITCTIQVNASTHAGADGCAKSGPTTPAVVALADTCTYAAATGDNVYLCAQVTIEGHGTYYWNDPGSPLVEGSWSNDPLTAQCSLAITIQP